MSMSKLLGRYSRGIGLATIALLVPMPVASSPIVISAGTLVTVIYGVDSAVTDNHSLAAGDGAYSPAGYRLSGFARTAEFGPPDGGFANADIYVSGENGALHGNLNLFANPVAPLNNYYVFGYGYIQGFDSLLFSGPDPTSIYRWTYKFHSGQEVQSPLACDDFLFPINIGTKAIATGRFTIGEGTAALVTASACSESRTDQTFTGLLTLGNGFGLNFLSSLEIVSGIHAYGDAIGGGTGSVRSYVDVINTAQFFIDPVTPGASYTSLSGNDYRTPTSSPPAVPEPGTLTLLGTGVAVLLDGVRRRRSASKN